MAQRVGRGIALLFHDHGTRRGRVVSSTPRPLFFSGKDPVPIEQEAGWAPWPVWTGGKSRPTGIRSTDLPARSSVAISTELPGPKCKLRKDLLLKTIHHRSVLNNTRCYTPHPNTTIVFVYCTISNMFRPSVQFIRIKGTTLRTV